MTLVTQVFAGKKYYQNAKNGYFTSPKGELMHRRVYSAEHGNVPWGWHVHHVDDDRSNNALENLVCMAPGDHARLHRTTVAIVCETCSKSHVAVVNPSKGNKYCSRSCANRARYVRTRSRA